MNDAVLIQQSWPGKFYEEMMELNRPRNEAYCKTHGFDYEYLVGVTSEKYGDLKCGSWVKVEMTQRALAKGYQYVASLEPDTLIADLGADLRDGCPKGIGACFHRVFDLIRIPAQWCVGAYYLQNTPETRAFVDEWLKGYPGDAQWRDNGVFNELGKKNRVVSTISDKWNATLNVNMCPDAVVVGFHGNGSAEQRLGLIRQTLERWK